MKEVRLPLDLDERHFNIVEEFNLIKDSYVLSDDGIIPEDPAYAKKIV